MDIKLYKISNGELFSDNEVQFIIDLSKTLDKNFHEEVLDIDLDKVPRDMIKKAFLSDIDMNRGDAISLALNDVTDWHPILESIRIT